MKTITLPAPGARVGAVCRAGDNASDYAGVVLCHVTDQWGAYAQVLMDCGRTDTCHHLVERGIGWRVLEAV